MAKLTQAAEEKEHVTDNRVVRMLAEIAAAKKREKDYLKEGRRILNIYEGKKKDGDDATPYNILYSNTETLLPALYSAVPRPVVQRRFKDDDPIGKASSEAGQRVLEFLVDTNIEGYETYDESIRAAVLDALLPGRGATSLKYDAEIGEMPKKDMETPDDEKVVADATESPADEYKKSELVCTETRSWDKVWFGYAKRWAKVPWIAYEEQIDKTEATRLFGENIAGQLNYYVGGEKDEDGRKDDDERNRGETKTTTVYQVWHKRSKKVVFISEQYDQGFLKENDDPLGLTGFFNMPKPIMFLEKSNDLIPVALYVLYENQAKELNRLTVRIGKIVEAIKARGFYDSELGDDLANIMDAEDNTLVPADKSASLAAEKGLANAIWFMPIQELTNTLIQLYGARQQCKQIIYEITGISDIMRGSTNANETLGAQEIKKSFGTLRLKRLQGEVQRYARDLLRMMLEIAATKFSEETWEKMTGLKFLNAQQEMEAQRIKMAAMQSQQPLDPKTEEFINRPSWSAILALLKDDTQRAYRVDIESNSTVQPEATEDQKNIAEVMNALAQFLNGVSPLVQSEVLPFEAAQTMMLAITRRFRFGSEIEEQLKKMKAPTPQDDGKKAEEAKAQQEQAKMAAQQQEKQAQMMADVENKKTEAMAAAQEKEVKAKQMVAEKEIEARKEVEAEKVRENSKQRIATMEADKKANSARETARIAAQAQIIIAKINNGISISDAELSNMPVNMMGETDVNSQSEKALTDAIAMLAQAIQAMSAPKETVITQRDEQGRAIASVQRPVTVQ